MTRPVNSAQGVVKRGVFFFQTNPIAITYSGLVWKKDGDFAGLMRLTQYLHRYVGWWRAAFWNLVVLIVIALIAWFLHLSTDFSDPRTWPWWLYLLVLIFESSCRSPSCGRHFFFYLYKGLRWMPLAIKAKRSQHALTLKWRWQVSNCNDAHREKLVAEAVKQLNPKDVEELRKQGLL
jgi:hypothetical protein